MTESLTYKPQASVVYGTNAVSILRLVNAEIVVASRVILEASSEPLTADSSLSVKLIKPRQLLAQMRPGPNGSVSMTINFVPVGGPLMGEVSLNEIYFRAAHVLQQEPANSDIAKAYVQATSGLVMAKPNDLPILNGGKY